MNVLIVHDLPALGDAASHGPPAAPVVAFSHVGAADLAQRIAKADFIAVARAVSTSADEWSAAMSLITARDIPLATVKLMPSRLFGPAGVSGTCAMRMLDSGEVEVTCLAQQLALQRAAALLRGEPSAPQPETDSAGARVTRFVFEGD
ncbi:MAG TPA: hypothetical protein VJ608_13750 [Albitalea sp.]|nr:hypothetical protein [Albitalea sp.]